VKPSLRNGQIRGFTKDVQTVVREAMQHGCELMVKGRSNHAKLKTPSGVLIPIPGYSKLLRVTLKKNGVNL
jgi:hypothetical protein